MKNYLEIKGQKFEQGASKEVLDKLVHESPLQININYMPYLVTMRTAGADKELVRGLLYTENIFIAKNDKFNYKVTGKIKESEIINKVSVEIPPHEINKNIKDSRNILTGSSCGICGITSLDELNQTIEKVETSITIQTSQIAQWYDQLKERQILFNETGGCHAAGMINFNYELIYVYEDIGRHNAVDKCIGAALLDENLDEMKILLVSGRLSFEIVQKASMAGIEILAAVSSPSSLAVEYAEEKGITIIGFARGEKLTVYSGAQRVS